MQGKEMGQGGGYVSQKFVYQAKKSLVKSERGNGGQGVTGDGEEG